MSDEARQRRAQQRAAKMTLVKSQITNQAPEVAPITGPQGVSLAFELTRMSWAMAGLPMPTYTRHTIPIVFAPSPRR